MSKNLNTKSICHLYFTVWRYGINRLVKDTDLILLEVQRTHLHLFQVYGQKERMKKETDSVSTNLLHNNTHRHRFFTQFSSFFSLLRIYLTIREAVICSEKHRLRLLCIAHRDDLSCKHFETSVNVSCITQVTRKCNNIHLNWRRLKLLFIELNVKSRNLVWTELVNLSTHNRLWNPFVGESFENGWLMRVLYSWATWCQSMPDYV